MPEHKYNKKEFIKAYVSYFGGTKKEAAFAYSISSSNYIKVVIDSFYEMAEQEFHND